MAAEIIDGLVKTLSKTTKEIGKATKELGARAEQGIEAQKIRNKIASEERIIEKIKVDIGDVIYILFAGLKSYLKASLGSSCT